MFAYLKNRLIFVVNNKTDTMRTLEQLDRKICKAVGVDYKEYQEMNLSEQFKVRSKYLQLKNQK